MNANTALKINDAVDQAIRCGESADAVLAQVGRALVQAIQAKASADIQRFTETVSSGRETWKAGS